MKKYLKIYEKGTEKLEHEFEMKNYVECFR